jgi:hypothetical protein
MLNPNPYPGGHESRKVTLFCPGQPRQALRPESLQLTPRNQLRPSGCGDLHGADSAHADRLGYGLAADAELAGCGGYGEGFGHSSVVSCIANPRTKPFLFPA